MPPTCVSFFSRQGLQGTLFKYGPGPSHVAMMTGRHSRHLVLVGGLTDGLLALPYAPQLHRRLDEASWSCVQCQLTSSYQARARRRRPPRPPLPRTRWPRSNRPTGAERERAGLAPSGPNEPSRVRGMRRAGAWPL